MNRQFHNKRRWFTVTDKQSGVGKLFDWSKKVLLVTKNFSFTTGCPLRPSHFILKLHFFLQKKSNYVTFWKIVCVTVCLFVCVCLGCSCFFSYYRGKDLPLSKFWGISPTPLTPISPALQYLSTKRSSRWVSTAAKWQRFLILQLGLSVANFACK